jgi:hypothetical protein
VLLELAGPEAGKSDPQVIARQTPKETDKILT